MAIKASAPPHYGRVKTTDWLMRAVLLVATLLTVGPLLLIVGHVTMHGVGALNVEFFTEPYEPPEIVGNILANTFEDEDAGAEVILRGGILHGIVGTLIVTIASLVLVVPIGVLSGIFLSEFGNNRIGMVVRFACDVLSGAPSIIVGVVAYVLIVQKMQEFSVIAGAVALAFLMAPTITRATEEMMRLIPIDMREAAMALGAPTWYSTFTVIVPAALPGIVTGVMLALARGAGETAPLILTILGNNMLTFDLVGPIHALPLIIYKYTDSPYPVEHTIAWGTAFVLMVFVLAVNILMRVITHKQVKRR